MLDSLIRPAGLRLRDVAICVHRWMGLAFCLLFVLWFVSGMVMMYSDYPGISAKDRLSKSEALAPEAIYNSPAAAYSSLHWSQPPDQVWLAMLEGRAVYRFRRGRSQALVYADNGEMFRPLTEVAGARIAAGWTGKPAARFQRILQEADQWTLGGQFNRLRPVFKYAWPDGEEVYVSSVTGEVAQHTTRASRMAAYFGAIPHWLYFTPLRKNGPLWNGVVVWSSGLGVVTCLFGLLAGVWMYSPSKRFRYDGEPSSIPYRGPKRWHMIFGLIFGLVTCTWAFSGMLSMEPFEWLSDGNDGAFRILRRCEAERWTCPPLTPSLRVRRCGRWARELRLKK